ncbi:unnamed protein product [Heterobilharzia americana]|nr:unnamed protein product [Heterobilharzia americana]
MVLIESLLPELHSFLAVDLNNVQLPPSIEQKRRRLLERIDVLSLGPIPPLPRNTITTTSVCPVGGYDSISNSNSGSNNNNNNGLTISQRRPLSSIARFFSNKRYSLPPTITCPSPPVFIDVAKTAIDTPGTSSENRNSQVSDILQLSGQSINGIASDSPDGLFSFDRSSSLLLSSDSPPPPPLPPKKSHLQKLFSKLEDPYEVPKQVVLPSSLVTPTDAPGIGTIAASSTTTPIRSKSSVTSTNEPLFRRKEFSRLSLSPQLEVIQTNRNSNILETNPNYAYDISAIPQTVTTTADPMTMSDTSYAMKHDGTTILPKKNLLGCQTRRPSSLMDPVWTLAGVLSHRYKPSKWMQLNFCLLTNSSRLIAYKTGHSVTPSLALFLCGSTGIYSGRDSGMEHVIKITYSSREIIVLAAPTEEQALIWVRQINQYSEDYQSLNIHPNDRNLLSSKSPGSNNRPVSIEVTCTQVDSGLSVAAISSFTEHNRTDRFLESVNHPKSSSFDDSNVGYRSRETDSKCNRTSTEKTMVNVMTSPVDLVTASDYFDTDMNESNHCLSSNPIPTKFLLQMTSSSSSSTFDTNSINPKQNLRRNSLISSMRRKVESFSSKRRARKSLPQSLQPNSLSVENHSDLLHSEILMGHRRMLSDGQWKNSLSCSKFSSVQCLQQQQQQQKMFSPPPPPPPAAACIWDSSGSSGKGFGWSQLESAGARFLNQHTSSVISNSTSGRPRSMCYDSLALFDMFASSQGNLNVTPKHGPLLDLNSIRSHSITSQTPNDNQIVMSGHAFISIPGRVPWTTKWCCLKSKCLEIYLNKRDPDNCVRNTVTDYMGDYSWPLFSLPLEAGKVELGLAGGDKRHSSAIRLAVPTQCSTPLLFDAMDKLQMGAWIRGFIQALGLISSSDNSVDADIQKKRDSLDRISSTDLSKNVHPSVVQDGSFQHTAVMRHQAFPTVSSSWIGRIPNSIMETSQTSMYYSEIHDDDGDDNDANDGAFIVNQRHESCAAASNTNHSGMVIYDEVCPPQPTASSITSTTDINVTITPPTDSTEIPKSPAIGLSKRRWSSPLLIVGSSTKVPVPVYSDELNTPSAYNTSHWHIPPPSRRLLSQPLPPLPSVGPSTCESMAGTITSSYTSSNITPDDLGGYQEELPTSTTVNLESDGCSEFRSKKERNMPNYKSSYNSTASTHRRYASMSSLEYSVPADKQRTKTYHEDCDASRQNNHKNHAHTKMIKQFQSHTQSNSSCQFSSNDDDVYSEPEITSGCISMPTETIGITSLACTTAWITVSTSNAVAIDSEIVNSSSLCSAFTLIPPSDVTTLHKTDSNTGTTGTDVIHGDDIDDDDSQRNSAHEVSLWKLKAENTLSSRDPALVEYMKVSKLIGARRCVSCLSGNKPKVLQTNLNIDGIPVSSSTLPVRCGSDDPVKHVTVMMNMEGTTNSTTTNDPFFVRKTNTHWNRGSYSSNSSRTATSSGVALTAESSSPGSGGTTRPPSLAITSYLPVTPVEEEKTNIEDFSIHDQNSYRESDDIPLNIKQQHSVNQHAYSDYGCQVEIPSHISVLSCHQHHHHYHHRHYSHDHKKSVDRKLMKNSTSPCTSLILVASQLEEVKQETNSLRSRKRDLSFRLSNLLADEHHEKYGENKTDGQWKLDVDFSSPNDKIYSDQEDKWNGILVDQNTCDGDHVVRRANNIIIGDKVGKEEQTNIVEEATASLYARLTVVEMLLKNAESTEARLEKEFGHLMINDSGTKPLSSSSSKINTRTAIFNEEDFVNNANTNICPNCKITCSNKTDQIGISRKRNRKYKRRGYKSNPSTQQQNSDTVNSLSEHHGRGRGRTTRRHLIGVNFSQQSQNDCSSLTVSLAS